VYACSDIPAGLYIPIRHAVYIINVRVRIYIYMAIGVYAYTRSYTYMLYLCIYYTLVEQMKCERARETVIIIFVRTVGGRGCWRLVKKGAGVGFALDISLIPGHGSLFVSWGEECMCTRVCIRDIGEGKTRAYVCMCIYIRGEGGGRE